MRRAIQTPITYRYFRDSAGYQITVNAAELAGAQNYNTVETRFRAPDGVIWTERKFPEFFTYAGMTEVDPSTF